MGGMRGVEERPDGGAGLGGGGVGQRGRRERGEDEDGNERGEGREAEGAGIGLREEELEGWAANSIEAVEGSGRGPFGA